MNRTPEGTGGLVFNEPLIFEHGSKGQEGYSLPEWEGEGAPPGIPRHLLREDLEGFSQLLDQAKQWGYRIDVQEWERFFLLRLEQAIRGLFRTEEVGSTLAKAETILKGAERLGVKLNLWNIQNLYVEVCNKRAPILEAHREAVTTFASRIQMNPDALPRILR